MAKNNTGENNSGDCNNGNRNSGYCNSGDCNNGNRNSGYCNSGNRNSGDCNSGDWNSGDCNSGNRNSGIFNTNEPKMRAFNKESDLTYTEFRSKFGYKDISLPLCSWIGKDDMTKEEKESVSGWSEMGGYLKTLSYKEAWAKAWSEASQEQKDWYLSLPNFDAGIFKEITGIDVKQPSLKGKTVTVKLDGQEYTAIIQ